MPTATESGLGGPCRTVGPQRVRLAALVVVLAAVGVLSGCGGAPKKGEVRLGDVSGATPRAEPKAKYGNMRSYVVFGKTYYPKQTSRGHTERGIASWYGPKFHGKKTSSGEMYDMHQMTAAHKTLPLPTYVLVSNLENGRNLILKVNDRGPFVGDRIIDLSYAAAKYLGVDKKGTAMVQVTSIDPRDHDGEVPKSIAVANAELERYRARSASGSRASSRVASTRPPAESKPSPQTSGPSVATRPAAASSQAPQARPAVAQTNGGYSLQVGAFGTRANAEQMRRQLQGQLSASVSVDSKAHAATAGGVLYRVRVGPVGSRADAQRLSEQLAALGVGSSLVVPH